MPGNDYMSECRKCNWHFSTQFPDLYSVCECGTELCKSCGDQQPAEWQYSAVYDSDNPDNPNYSDEYDLKQCLYCTKDPDAKEFSTEELLKLALKRLGMSQGEFETSAREEMRRKRVRLNEKEGEAGPSEGKAASEGKATSEGKAASDIA